MIQYLLNVVETLRSGCHKSGNFGIKVFGLVYEIHASALGSLFIPGHAGRGADRYTTGFTKGDRIIKLLICELPDRYCLCLAVLFIHD